MKDNDKRAKIIETGFYLLDKNGYHGTGISDILKHAQIPKGSFYHYFKSKEEFTVEVIKFYTDTVLDGIDSVLQDNTASPSARLTKLYADYAELYFKSNLIPYGGFASKLNQEVGDVSEIIRNAANEVYSRIRQAHINCLQEAVNIGELQADTNVNMLAEIIIYAWEGALLRMKGSYSNYSLSIFTEMLEQVFLRKK